MDEDGWYNNGDPFDSIVRQFFGEPARRVRRSKTHQEESEEEENEEIIQFIEAQDHVYLIFELPGYNEEDVSVSVIERKIEIIANKKESDKVVDYLSHKLSKGIVIRRTLPSFINPKGFSFTCKNGILEVKFLKK